MKDLDELTRQELIQLKDSIAIELEDRHMAEKIPVYEIQLSNDLSNMFKDKSEALLHIIKMANSDDEFFDTNEPILIQTIRIDKIEYDKHPDSWLLV